MEFLFNSSINFSSSLFSFCLWAQMQMNPKQWFIFNYWLKYLELWILAICSDEPQPPELPQPHHLEADRDQDVLGSDLPSGRRIRPGLRLTELWSLRTAGASTRETKPVFSTKLAGKYRINLKGQDIRDDFTNFILSFFYNRGSLEINTFNNLCQII